MKPDTRAIILAAMPGTRGELATCACVSKVTAGTHITALQAAEQCHIADWRSKPRGGTYEAVFAAGHGVDVVCPFVATTTKVQQQRHQAKAKLSGAWQAMQARRSAKKKADRAIGKRWAAALFATETRGYF